MKKVAVLLSFAVVVLFASCKSEPQAEAVVEEAAVEVVDSTACQEACCDSTAVCDSVAVDTAKAE